MKRKFGVANYELFYRREESLPRPLRGGETER